MNKKEISEIRKQFTDAHCTISRICGCYVDADKNKVADFAGSFLTLPDEECVKYYEIFRKVLSGSIGKNLMNMDFPLEAEMEGGKQAFLLSLRDTALKDEELVDAYYEKVISSFEYVGNYLILLIHAAYDVPGRSSDNLEMDDASDEVYSYILSAVCPVSLEKPALSYDADEQCFHDRVRDWIVSAPELGFLFPAFNDRSTDIHSLLFYTKNAKNQHEEFNEALLSCPLPLPGPSQQEVFADVIEETLGEACTFEMIRGLHDQIHELTERAKESPDPVVLQQGEVKNLLSLAGADTEQIQQFDKTFEETAGSEAVFMPTNLRGNQKFEVQMPDVQIKVSPDRSDLIQTRKIDGRDCLVIAISDDVTVNGIRVRPESNEA
ncbi:MAG: DUF4317 domain-containing protein [Lachnospiraceae bacterium]|nr:DUF4317 domain-containing protein [Lachnospiraceae bacterium]